MNDDTAWVDGAFTSRAGVTLGLDTLSLQFGLGVVEHIPIFRRLRGELVAFRLPDHLDTALATARMLEIVPAWSTAALVEVCQELVQRCGSALGWLDIFLLGDVGTPGLATRAPAARTVIRFNLEPATSNGAPARAAGALRTTFSSIVRPHPAAFQSQANVLGNRAALWLAQRGAVRSGFDAALQLDAAGYVAGAAFADVFCVIRERVVIPPTSLSVAGLARDTLSVLAAESGYYVEERPLTREQLLQADEVFLVGGRHSVEAVMSVDHVAIGVSAEGPVTRRLKERLHECTAGSDSNHPEWLFLL